MNFIIIDLFSKIVNCQVVENVFLEKMICDSLKNHIIFKNLAQRDKKKSPGKNKVY